MIIQGSVIVVTGAAGGIGAAMARRFLAEGAATVVVADLDLDRARAVADPIGAEATALDVTDESAIAALVADVVARHGRIDLFCSNAGVANFAGIDAPMELWRQAIEVNLMAHVFAARAVLPVMVAQGSGYLLQTASAAGLLTSPGDAGYAVSKHGAVALAEYLAIHYRPQGINVSVLCPMGVSTPLLMEPLAEGNLGAGAVAASGAIITAEEVADVVVAGLTDERFLILPHPEVGRYWAKKAADPERWLESMTTTFGTTFLP